MDSGCNQDHHIHDEDRQGAQEGLFDAQLTFSAPFIEAPQPVQNIIKRDGRLEPFNKRKIAETIFKAASSIGGNDRERANSIASGVAIYLSKTLKGQSPTVDQVGDAVEKVLIEMGHARTALTYARYRDRRARIRKLRQGDTQAILNELAEARAASAVTGPAAGAQPPVSLFIRTANEQLRMWDRTRIVQALVRETSLDEATADLIALEVEKQVAAANVKTLTTGLVREMVNAKLIEHGLESHWGRHVRLGVPLYDVKRIVCGLNSDTAPLDPERTSQVLAQSVKREYALSQVFSPEVGDLHLRGDLYLHDLGQIDRLQSATLSPGAIARYGVGLPDSREFSRPPKYADTLLAQMVNASNALQNHFSSGIVWDALNVHFAPFLEGFDGRMLRQVAQMLVYEYAYRAAMIGDNAPRVAIDLYWDIPNRLKSQEATGPTGAPTEKPYAAYARLAQQFAWALFDVYKEGGVGGVTFTSPCARVHITPDFFRSPGHEEFLEHVSEVAAQRGNVLFVLQRTDDPVIVAPWESGEVWAHRVTLNLPRLAYASADAQDFFSRLGGLTEHAARAHLQKASFIENLMALEAVGPLGLLTVRRNGKPEINMARANYLMGVCGLAECVRVMTCQSMACSDKAMTFALETMSRIADMCAEWSDTTGFSIVPAATTDSSVLRRFAAIDLESHRTKASGLLKMDASGTVEPAYTPGARLGADAEITPFERVGREGRLHAHLRADAASVIEVPDSETSGKSVVDFIQKAYHQTHARCILISR